MDTRSTVQHPKKRKISKDKDAEKGHYCFLHRRQSEERKTYYYKVRAVKMPEKHR